MSYRIGTLRKGVNQYCRCVKLVELLPADNTVAAQEESWIWRRTERSLKEVLF